MADWINKLDDFLRLSERAILNHAGKITHEAALEMAESEYHRFLALEATKPSQVEKHFDEALERSKQLEKKAGKPRKPRKRR
jgi:hypothetical protein